MTRIGAVLRAAQERRATRRHPRTKSSATAVAAAPAGLWHLRPAPQTRLGLTNGCREETARPSTSYTSASTKSAW
eukprot:12615052-Alexandrium_andersonii.AAC.1